MSSIYGPLPMTFRGAPATMAIEFSDGAYCASLRVSATGECFEVVAKNDYSRLPLSDAADALAEDAEAGAVVPASDSHWLANFLRARAEESAEQVTELVGRAQEERERIKDTPGSRGSFKTDLLRALYASDAQRIDEQEVRDNRNCGSHIVFETDDQDGEEIQVRAPHQEIEVNAEGVAKFKDRRGVEYTIELFKKCPITARDVEAANGN